MNHLPLRRALASAVCLSLILACPGPASYAAAQSVARGAAAAPAAGPAVPVVGFGGASLSMPVFMPSALGLMTPASGAPSAPTPLAAAPAIPAPAASLKISAERPTAPAKTVSAAATAAAEALKSAGPIANAAPASANGLGRKLEAALTDALAPNAGSDLSSPAAGRWGVLAGSRRLAGPAGDRVAAAVSADDSGVPPAPPAVLTPAPKGPSGPLWPRLLSAGLALAPALFLGPSLFAASAYLVGGLVIAASVTLAVMPFLGESSPKVLRAAPGLMLSALGAAAAPASPWIGALALLGGWGLTRYGLGKSKGRYGSYGSVETLSAFFGGLAALTGVALAASTPLGWTATGLLWLSYPLAALLWPHLPGWIGEGLTAALEGVWHGAFGLSRSLTALHRDTVLLDRLENFSKRHWASSKWNGVWLTVLWTPIVLAETAMYVLSGLGGLVLGAVTAPVLFLWGASAKLWPESKANVYFAEAARLVFDNVQNGKVARFNPLEAKLIPLANSPRFFARAAGALGIRALQLGWLGYALIAAPLLSIAGLVLAFSRAGAYDSKRHSLRSLRINRDDSPSEKPTEPNEPEPGAPAKAPIAPKLIAVALALVPAYFFGLPILAGHSLIQIPLYFALALPLAAMPFLGKAPDWAKSFAGHALFYNGLVLLLTGSAIYVGLIALLGGWGFNSWVKKTQEKGGRFDEAELGAFFGALCASAAVGAVWAGFLGGWIGWGTLALAAVTSPFLLMHLPKWVWKGVRGFLGAFPKSMESFHDVASFWRSDTKFHSNLERHASYWLKKTYWNGVWLSAIWVPTGLIQAAEWVLSIALGAAIGLLRSPFAFAAAAFKEAKPYSKTAIVMDGLLKGWSASSEGSKTLFDRLVSGLKPAMDEAATETGRPTAKAVGALALARVVQVFWLAGVLAMNLSGLSFLYGAYQGIRAAFAPAKPYRLYTQGFEIDEPLNGGNANQIMTTQGMTALRSLLKTLTAEFDRAKVPYDKAAFTVEALQGSGIQLVDHVSNQAYVSVFGVIALTEQQAVVARRYALFVQYNPPARFAGLP